MANMIDYLAWRGDLSLAAAPWNEIDGVLFSAVCYLDFREINTPEGRTLEEADREELAVDSDHNAFAIRKKTFQAMARSARFAGCRMHHFITLTDREQEMQFSATCYDLPDGTLCVAFRGTDATVIGWREDLNMSLLEPVAGQEAARFYLEKALELDDRRVRVLGHSKGGNLGMYAAAHLSAEQQERICGIWSYDGPGMSPDVFAGEGYQRIAPKIHHFVPQTSIIGLLMEYPRPYTVVHSTAGGIQQHDIMSWEVRGPHFEELESIDENAVTIRDTLQEWLQQSDKKERAAFLETAFRMVDSTKATTVGELMGDKMKNLRLMMGERRDIKPEMKKDFNKLMSLFLSLGVDNVMDNVMDKVRLRFGDKAGEAEEDQERKALAEAAEAELVRRGEEKAGRNEAEKPEAGGPEAGETGTEGPEQAEGTEEREEPEKPAE